MYVGDLEHPSTSSSGLIAAGGTQPQYQSSIQRTSAVLSTVSQDPTLEKCENLATTYFQKNFLEVEYGVACSVCERLWFKKDVRPAIASFQPILERMGLSVEDTALCNTCCNSVKRSVVPKLAVFNGFRYPSDPGNLPVLNSITRRLISPRIPFMQVRRLRYDTGRYSIVGQVINVPVDVQKMVSTLPRSLSEDESFNVTLKKSIVHKSSAYSGVVKRSEVKAWLDYLQTSPLYLANNICIDWNRFSALESETTEQQEIEELQSATESELLLAR